MHAQTVLSLLFRVVLTTWAAVQFTESLCANFATSHRAALAIVAAIVVGTVFLREIVRRPRDCEQCPECEKIDSGLGLSLGPRVDTLLRAEALIAATLITLAWCEHCPMATSHARTVVLVGGLAVAVAAAWRGKCVPCKKCGSACYGR